MISLMSMGLISYGIVRIILSCELAWLELALLVIFDIRLVSKLPCLFPFLFYFLMLFRFLRTPCCFFSSFLSRGRRGVSYLLIFFSFSRNLKLLIINRERNRQSSAGSILGLLQWGHSEPSSDADDVSLLLVDFKKIGHTSTYL